MSKQDNEQRLAKLKNIVLVCLKSQEVTNTTTRTILLYM